MALERFELDPLFQSVILARKDDIARGKFLLKRRKIFDAPYPFYDQIGNPHIGRDIFVARQVALRKEEDALLPVEKAVNDVADLILNAFPKLLRRYRADFDQDLALTPSGSQHRDGAIILLPRDLPCGKH